MALPVLGLRDMTRNGKRQSKVRDSWSWFRSAQVLEFAAVVEFPGCGHPGAAGSSRRAENGIWALRLDLDRDGGLGVGLGGEKEWSYTFLHRSLGLVAVMAGSEERFSIGD